MKYLAIFGLLFCFNSYGFIDSSENYEGGNPFSPVLNPFSPVNDPFSDLSKDNPFSPVNDPFSDLYMGKKKKNCSYLDLNCSDF